MDSEGFVIPSLTVSASIEQQASKKLKSSKIYLYCIGI